MKCLLTLFRGACCQHDSSPLKLALVPWPRQSVCQGSPPPWALQPLEGSHSAQPMCNECLVEVHAPSFRAE